MGIRLPAGAVSLCAPDAIPLVLLICLIVGMATFKRCASLWPFVQYFFIVLIVIAHIAYYSNTRVIIKTGKWGWAQLYCYLRTAIASNNIGQGPHSGAWLGLIPSHLC